jgi:radical SAM protein with 4Fe4S-binding SPASM domain
MQMAVAESYPRLNAPAAAEGADVACAVPQPSADPFIALMHRLHGDHVPFYVTWEMTHQCNLDCVMCYNSPLNQPELTTAEGMALLDQLAEAGSLRLTLTGGEILTRRDFFPLAQHARERGFALTLKTNATLITPAVADRIAALQPFQVDVSLLGATDATFDAIAGSRHTLTRVLRGVRLLQERGVAVKLNSLLLTLNLQEQAEMSRLAAELGVFYEQTLKISPSDTGEEKAGQHQLSREQMEGVISADGAPLRPRMTSDTARTCSVGLASCLITPYGEVLPCIELRIPAGNVRTQPFGTIWQEAPIFRDLRTRHMVGELPECRICPLRLWCEGRCAGLAWKEHGDPYGAHRLACEHAQARFASLHPGEPVPETPLQIGRNRHTIPLRLL